MRRGELIRLLKGVGVALAIEFVLAIGVCWAAWSWIKQFRTPASSASIARHTDRPVMIRRYGEDGGVVMEWRAKFIIKRGAGYVEFVTTDDRQMAVSGSFVVEE